MRRKILPYRADFKEAIKPENVEEIKGEKYLAGVIPIRFDYITNTDGFIEKIARIKKTETNLVVRTYPNFKIKPGDRFIIDGGNWDVLKAEKIVPEEFKDVIARYPNSKRAYEEYIIELV